MSSNLYLSSSQNQKAAVVVLKGSLISYSFRSDLNPQGKEREINSTVKLLQLPLHHLLNIQSTAVGFLTFLQCSRRKQNPSQMVQKKGLLTEM